MKLWRTKELFKISGYSKVGKALRSGALRSRMTKGVIYVEHAWLVAWLGFDPLTAPETSLPDDRAPGRRRYFKDRTGQRYGQLVALSWERRKKVVGGRVLSKIYWLCRCDCGNQQEVASSCFTSRKGQEGLRCLACSDQNRREKVSRVVRQRQRRHFPRLPETSPYVQNYRRYRARFSPEQRRRYEELMVGRRGERNEALAVDVVMREPQPGGCCEPCLKQKRPAEERQTLAAAQRPEHSEARESRPLSQAGRLALLRAVYQRRQGAPPNQSRRQPGCGGERSQLHSGKMVKGEASGGRRAA